MATTPNRNYQLPIRADLKASYDQIVSALGAIDVDVAAAFAALALRATLNSPAFTGAPTAPTQDPGNNSSRLATTAFVAAAVLSFSPSIVNASSLVGTIDDARLSFQVSSYIRALLLNNSAAAARTTLDVFSKAEVTTAIAALVDAAPGTLDTLNELAAALGDDPNFATSMMTLLAGKATKADGTQALARALVDTAQRTWRATDLKDAAIAAGGGAADAVLEDRKLSGVAGGNFVSGAFRTRTLNTKAYDPAAIITLAGDEFTPSVNCRVRWRAPACAVAAHVTRLFNVADGVTVASGSGAEADSGPNAQTDSVGWGTAVAGKAYRVEHWATNTRNTFGFGVAVGSGESELYTSVEIWRTA
ncbi:hypothetical protein NKL07_21800 [Mesorhizobium sp. C280B]|uniref:hypothetical protein n=1 Tax=unclassified Mesorhizobium TaxID=325217 RepID=UPI0003CE5C58|nr:hypothetical protein [Mesorhizobium sp. LSJC280B00]ESW92920.1 hypothetical protein X772_02875 [Mesorhizobium sp. LSJC280B00]